jgi:preprotein translocase subunit YajC
MKSLAFLLTTFLSISAFAQNSGASKPSFLMQMVPILAFVLIFFFLVIRPNAKKQKIQQEFMAQLKRGDEVLTSSGIFGTIEGLTEKFVTLEVAQGVRIRVLRSSVAMSSKEVKND